MAIMYAKIRIENNTVFSYADPLNLSAIRLDAINTMPVNTYDKVCI